MVAGLLANSTADLDDSRDLKQQSFNMSAFAKSYRDSMDSSMLNRSDLSNSRFYPGKTTYGGMASRRSFNLPKPTPYRRVKKTDAGKSSSKALEKPRGSTTAAELILRALDQTGMDQVKVKSSSSNSKMLSPAVYLRKRSSQFKSKPTANAPPTNEIIPVTKATIMANIRPQVVKKSRETYDKSFSDVRVAPVARTSANSVDLALKTNIFNSPQRSVSNIQDNSVNQNLQSAADSSKSTSNFVASNEQKFDFSLPKPASGETDTQFPVSPSVKPFGFSFPSQVSLSAEDRIFPKGLSVVQSSASSTTPQSSGWDCFAKADTEKWRCECCLVQNGAEMCSCAACGTKKKASSSSEISADVTSPSGNWGGSKGQPASGVKSVVEKPASDEKVAASSGWGDLFQNKGLYIGFLYHGLMYIEV